MIIDQPIYISQSKNLLQNPLARTHPLLVENQLHLAAWLVSGIPYRNKKFLKKQQISSAHPGGKTQKIVHFSMEQVEQLV